MTARRWMIPVAVLSMGLERSWAEARAATPSPAVGESQAAAPAPAGAREDVVDVVIWSVDDDRGIKRWGDAEWTGHARLLRLLGDAGLRPRVEHLAGRDFPDRWDEAVDRGHPPELITVDRFTGLLVNLEARGRLIRVQSGRLTFRPEAASCADFRGRWLFLVIGVPHESEGRKAVEELLKPGQETRLPGAGLPATAGRAEAILIAKRAVVAYVSGDSQRIKDVASSSSPQLSRCTRPQGYRRGWDVEAGSVEIRGNDVIAFARVEVRYRGRAIIGADPVAVILRREGPRWKAFSVGHDVFCVRALPDLCRLVLHPPVRTRDWPTPRLLYPDDGGAIGPGDRSFVWEVPAGGESPAAQIAEVLQDEQGASWPWSRIAVYPGEPRGRSLTASETMEGLTGMTSAEMRWCVWTIGSDGRITPSEVRRYRIAPFKP
jgi:hypothetical protein